VSTPGQPVAVHALVSGREDGPAVVLSNSLGADHRMWDPQVAALEEHFRVIRYDTRGHGSSPVPPGPYTVDDLADDVVALLDRLGIERAHVVGLSLGGATAMRLAVRHPDRVDRLALLCTAAVFLTPQMWADRAAAVRTDGVRSIAGSIVDRWFTPDFLATRPEDRAAYETMVGATPDEGYAGCCDALASFDTRSDLAHIRASTLVIGGAQDPATPTSKQQEIADGIPGARLLVVPDAAHLANAEQPGVITPALIDHLTDDPHDTEKNA